MLSNSYLRRREILIVCLFYLMSISTISLSQSVNIIEVKPWESSSLSTHDRAISLLKEMTIEEKASLLLFNSPAIDRLGINEYDWWNEALHGVARSGRATVFPQAIGLAASFDKDLIYRVADVISTEARIKYNNAIKIGNRGRYAGLTFWSPNVNIFRDPRWGRGQETYGEDPLLSAQLGKYFVNGLQGNNPKYLKAAACAKHFVVHSGPEAVRHEFNAEPSMKDFYETYLPAFDTLVRKANVSAVMCAYNRTFGEPCCGSAFLDLDILRDEWGFKGYHVSDCWALSDMHKFHKYTSSVEESAALALKNGIDLNCGSSYSSLLDAYNLGLVEENDIDTAVYRLLRIRILLGQFDKFGENPYDMIADSLLVSKTHEKIALEAAIKSVVMLKNNGVLPLKNDINKLMLLGPNASDAYIMLGNYYGIGSNIVTIMEGISAAINPGTSMEYRPAFLASREANNVSDWVTFESHNFDAIIVVMGLSNYIEGEEGDAMDSEHKGDRPLLSLPQNQIDFLKKLRKNGDKPIITIVTGGSPIFMEDIHENSDAVLFGWYPGGQGGTAIADIIFGNENPSGRLPISFPRADQKIPDFEDYSMKNRTYRYYEEEPFYPFGYGLSYGKFEYSSISADDKDVVVTVTNTNEYDGEEVVQLYISFQVKNLELPQYALKSFSRLKLKAGESKELRFSITNDMLVYYTEKGKKKLYKGYYKVYIGGSCPSPRANELGLSPVVEYLVSP